MLTRRTFLLGPIVAMVACHRKASPFPGYAFVANQEGRAIAVVDLKEFVLARYIALDASPTAVLGHPRRAAIYALTPETGAIHEISTASFQVSRKIEVARSAVSMRLAPDGASIWVLCRQPRKLVRLPLDPFRADVHVSLPSEPFDFDLSGDGKAAVSFGDDGGIAIADLPQRVSRSFDIGKKVSFVRFRSDDRQLFVGNAAGRALAIVEAASGRVIVNLPLAVRPDRICVKSDGGQVFITGDGMDAVVIVYPYTTEIAETVLAGRAPGAMAECNSSDADYLLLANPASGEVTIMDIDRRRAIAVAAVGQGPCFITTTPDQQYALVLNRDSGDMAVIRLALIGASHTKSVPLFTMIRVGSKPVSAIVRAT